jgi:hypothetical protein
LRVGTFTIGPFVPIPHLTVPSSSAAWDGQTVNVTVDPGPAFDLLEVVITSSDASTAWTIAAPGSARAIQLPQLPTELGLPPGSLNLSVWGARVDGFDFGKLRYAQLSRWSWNAYANDFGFGRY